MSTRYRSNVQRYTVKINIGPDLPTHSPSPYFSQPRPMPPKVPNLDWSSSGCDRLDNLFDKFCRLETSLSGKSERFIVKPSGRLSDCRLIIRMHYPNFSRCRHFFDFLDMADTFNMSMAILLAKLDLWDDRSRERVLIQDLFSRRIPILTRTNRELNRFGYAEDVVKAHVRFADDVWEQCDAPVGLLIGATVVEQHMRSGSRTDTVHVALEPRRMAFRSVGRFQLESGGFVECRSREHGCEIH
jgi:hypothetical protein